MIELSVCHSAEGCGTPLRGIKDRTAVKSALEKWAALPGLHRLVPFHGAVVESGAADALRAAAGSI